MKKRNTLITTLALTALLGGLVSCSSDSDNGAASEPQATDAVATDSTVAEDTSAHCRKIPSRTGVISVSRKD
jgi:hypothetical protein